MNHRQIGAGLAAAIAVVLALVLVLALGVAGCGEYKQWSRHQRVLNAENAVRITSVNIQRAQQQAKITRAEIEATKAEAEKRYQESIGIKRSQDEIAKTLTPAYLQHEAIQAQLKNPKATIYVPSGEQGIPLVQTVGR